FFYIFTHMHPLMHAIAGRRRAIARAALATFLLWQGRTFAAGGQISVLLTRQAGENGKLEKALLEALPSSLLEQVQVAEVPCIEHGQGPDFELLEVVLLTSPEAARVFAEAWRSARSPPCQVASVGKGTTATARAAGLEVIFEPSVANAESLASELPDFGHKLLYAASAIAPGTLEKGLVERGFVVQRLNTYTTQPVLQQTPEALALMESAQVATFGSPSAVRAWSKVTSARPSAACIGGTSRDAAEGENFQRIYSPPR
ncbi:unnamed protein product, partial [Effrenium voratum]